MGKKVKIFLGGTCNGSTWREDVIPFLEFDYFNPVVEDWTPECIEKENIEKEENCNIHLYVITKEMTGVYSIAEAVQSSNKKEVTTIFYVEYEGFDEAMIRSLRAVREIISNNGGVVYERQCESRENLAKSINEVINLTKI